MKAALQLLTNFISFTILYFKGITKKNNRGFVNFSLSNAKYLINTSLKKQYIFIHINKTGGSSIEKALGDAQQIHFSAYALKNYLGTQVFNSKFKFAFVRNPYDRIVSQYHYRLQNNQTNIKDKAISFKDWVRKCYVEQDEEYYNYPAMFQSQVDWLTDRDGKLIVDFIGKFENFEEDFKHVCYKLNIPYKPLPHARKSSRTKNYLNFYDEETLKIVSDKFTKDFAYFGYQKIEKLQ